MKIMFQVMICVTVVAAPRISSAGVDPEPSFDDLEPENGVMFEPGVHYRYLEELRHLLFKDTPNVRKCQVVPEDGFIDVEHEFTVFMLREAVSRTTYVVLRRASSSVRTAVLGEIFSGAAPSAGAPPDVRRISVLESRSAISEETADAMEMVCQMVLSTTRYPSPARPANHPYYVHFAHVDALNGYRAAKGRSGSVLVRCFFELLVRLGKLPSAPSQQRAEAERSLRRAAQELVDMLAKRGIAKPSARAVLEERIGGSVPLERARPAGQDRPHRQ